MIQIKKISIKKIRIKSTNKKKPKDEIIKKKYQF
jgi:hypothetical protein